jgi:hypothetical protein
MCPTGGALAPFRCCGVDRAPLTPIIVEFSLEISKKKAKQYGEQPRFMAIIQQLYLDVRVWFLLVRVSRLLIFFKMRIK